MPDDSVDQARAWEALGHAMAAGQAVELLFHIANFTARANKAFEKIDSEELEAQKEKIIENAQKSTFGQAANQFIELYPSSQHPKLTTALFKEAVENAKLMRNHLAHGFFLGAIRCLNSEAGLDLLGIECNLYRDHFERLAGHIRKLCPVDFEIFFSITQENHSIYLTNHPLREYLDDRL
jgi:hypothetical protein